MSKYAISCEKAIFLTITVSPFLLHLWYTKIPTASAIAGTTTTDTTSVAITATVEACRPICSEMLLLTFVDMDGCGVIGEVRSKKLR